MKNRKQMINGLGVLNIYFKMLGWSLLLILMFGGAVALRWAGFTQAADRWLFFSSAIVLYIVTGAVLLATWGDISPVWSDMKIRPTSLREHVVGKRAEKEFIGVGQYAHTETKYHIVVGPRRF